MSLSPTEQAKKNAGFLAAEMIKDGSLIGIGTGTTVSYFITALAKKCKEGLSIQAVATSNQSKETACLLGIPILDSFAVEDIDVTVDGADEIDANHEMIKGGGGALFKEKLTAMCSKKVMIIVDEKKIVSHLGARVIPVEISSYLPLATIARIHALNLKGVLRKGAEDHLFLTDNGNYIYDIRTEAPFSPKELNARLKMITGVIETGLFFDLSPIVIVGYDDGHTLIL